jgi:hypothetical protein
MRETLYIAMQKMISLCEKEWYRRMMMKVSTHSQSKSQPSSTTITLSSKLKRKKMDFSQKYTKFHNLSPFQTHPTNSPPKRKNPHPPHATANLLLALKLGPCQ